MLSSKFINPHYIFSILFCLLALINLTFVSFLFSQTGNEDACLEVIKQAYKKRNSPPSSSDQTQIYYLDYQITTILRDPTSNHITDVKVFIDQKQVRFLSREMSIYQDESNSFTVIPDRKMIYWGDSSMNLAKEMRVKGVANLQNKLFDLVEVTQCKDVELPNSKADKQIALQLDDQAQKSFPYERVTFIIDTTELFIHKVILDYPKPSKIARIEITFNEMSYNYKTDILDEPLMSLFFDDKQELLPKYEGYRLIDHRRSSRR